MRESFEDNLNPTQPRVNSSFKEQSLPAIGSLARDFRTLMATFLETPRDELEEQKLFSERADRLRERLISSNQTSLSDIQDLFADYATELLSMGKIKLVSLLNLMVPDGNDLLSADSKYCNAAKYALESAIKYENWQDGWDTADNILPHYTQSSNFADALSFRLNAVLNDLDLKEAESIVERMNLEQIVLDDNQPLASVVIESARKSAKAAVVELVNECDLSTVVNNFNLGDFLLEAPVQERVEAIISDFLDRSDLFNARLVFETVPVGDETLHKLRDRIEQEVRIEQAKLEFECIEEDTEAELYVYHESPLSYFIELYKLDPEFPLRTDSDSAKADVA